MKARRKESERARCEEQENIRRMEKERREKDRKSNGFCNSRSN